MTRSPLLVELFTEELPPKALKALGAAFGERLAQGLVDAQLVAAPARHTAYATPRRLGVSIDDVLDRAPDRVESKKLMPASVAFDAQGGATAALTKRLEKEGATAADVTMRTEGGVDHAWLERPRAGATLAQGLQRALDDAIAKLPIPKRMSYQRDDTDGGETTVQFVRPAHGLVALHGHDIVPVRALGLAAGRVTAGHRFLGMRRVSLDGADRYAATLRDDGRVVASFAERRAAIVAGLEAAAGDDRVVMPDALLDEVTALVEWPAVYRGTFDARFLAVPQECLILTMQQNQKYFALTDGAGRLVDRFLVVSNIATDDPSRIVGGNERVLRARLADAKFFFDQDRRTPLADRIEKLKTVVYHNRLGSQYQRMERVERLAGTIAGRFGADAAGVERARRAARLAKADLVTDMVGEFPELQGLMGRDYALHDGEDPQVAQAIEEQYRPRFAGDDLPTTATGICLALADKLDTLVSLFGIGAAPTGDKDPFALRRHALGVVRLLIENDLRVGLDELLAAATDTLGDVAHDPQALAALRPFVRERLASYLRDAGYSPNEVAAVLELDDDILADAPRRLRAVRAFGLLDEAASLASTNKRVRNILAKSGGAGDVTVRGDLLVESAERALNDALARIGPASANAFDAGDFVASLALLAPLKPPVDAFFEQVMVNVDDPALRANRLGLLTRLHATMNRVADLSKLAVA